MCQLKWLGHFVPRLNPYWPRDYPSIASKIPHGAKEVDRIPSDSNINLTHGHGHFLLFKQANTLQSRHFRLSLRFFSGEQFFLMTHRGLVSTCDPDLSVFFFGKIDRFFAVDPSDSARSLAKVFRRSLHYRATMRNWWRWPCSWRFFFFVRCGWVTGWSIYGEKGGSNVGVVFLFKRRYVLLL